MLALTGAALPLRAQLTGGLLFAGSSGEQRLAFQPDRNNFQPRIGFAYRLAGRWVLRGGYGLYYLGAHGGQPKSAGAEFTLEVPMEVCPSVLVLVRLIREPMAAGCARDGMVWHDFAGIGTILPDFP
jgi:hypothetical protein